MHGGLRPHSFSFSPTIYLLCPMFLFHFLTLVKSLRPILICKKLKWCYHTHLEEKDPFGRSCLLVWIFFGLTCINIPSIPMVYFPSLMMLRSLWSIFSFCKSQYPHFKIKYLLGRSYICFWGILYWYLIFLIFI